MRRSRDPVEAKTGPEPPGLHARPAMLFVETASGFEACVTVRRTDATETVDGKSIMQMMMLAATHMMYGHDQPGDGFTAGVIISLTIALWYVVFGYEETRRRLPWLHATRFIAAGILLAITTGLIAMAITGSFLGNHDFTESWHFLPKGFHISTSFLLELSICLAVLGGASHMLGSLGHPETTEEQRIENGKLETEQTTGD